MRKLFNLLMSIFFLTVLSGFATFFIAIFKPDGVVQALQVLKNFFGG